MVTFGDPTFVICCYLHWDIGLHDSLWLLRFLELPCIAGEDTKVGMATYTV